MATNDTGAQANKYTVGQFHYPTDAGVSADLPHTVVFFINVRGNSKGKTDTNTMYELKEPQTITSSGIAKSAVIVGATSAAAPFVKSLSTLAASTAIMGGASLRKVIGGQLLSGAKGVGSAVLNSKGGKVAALAGVGLGVMALTTTASKMYRLKDAITLAIQEPMKTTYNVEYENYDAGTLIGGSSTGADYSSMAAASILKAAKIPALIGAPDFARAIQKVSGESANPFRTALFKEVKLRTFDFKYKFMPKSAGEAANVLRIIKTFRYHMHPEFSQDKVFLVHPSEFNIAYYHNNKENSTWNKISTCVLTHMHLDAGSEGVLASFTDGMSVEINMLLKFTETEMMTKDKIDEGY